MNPTAGAATVAAKRPGPCRGAARRRRGRSTGRGPNRAAAARLAPRWKRSNTCGLLVRRGCPDPGRAPSTAPSGHSTSIGAAASGRTWRRCRAGSRSPVRRRRRLRLDTATRRRRPRTARPLRRSCRPTTPGRDVAERRPVRPARRSSPPLATATISSTRSTSSSISACRSSTTWRVCRASRSGWRRSTSRLVRRLVSGVRSSWPASCDEPLLVRLRRGERAEHAAERGAEAADLVVAADRHVDVEPTGLCDRFGGRREPAQRTR